MNLADALQTIHGWGRQTERVLTPLEFRMNGDPPHKRYLVDPYSKQIKECDADPPIRALQIDEPGDLVVAATVFEAGDAAVIFISENVVVLSLDEKGDRRQRYTMPLHRTDQFEFTLALGAWWRHGELIGHLTDDLYGAVDPAIVTQLRKLKFNRHASGGSSIAPGRASMGRDVEMSMVADDQEIPEQIVLSCAVYDEFPDCECRIVCSLITNLEEATFKLRPRAGEICSAERQTREHIKSTFERELESAGVECPVLCGGITA